MNMKVVSPTKSNDNAILFIQFEYRTHREAHTDL